MNFKNLLPLKNLAVQNWFLYLVGHPVSTFVLFSVLRKDLKCEF